MASPSDPVRPPNKKRRLKTQMRPAGPAALNKKKKRRVSGEEAEAEDKQTRIRSRNTDKTTSRELRKRAVVSAAASTAAAAGPAQLPLALPSVPANPSTPVQRIRYGERLVFCAPYHSFVQRYRLSDSPEPAPSPSPPPVAFASSRRLRLLPSPSPPPVEQYREQSVTAAAAESASAAGPAQPPLSLPSAPANPSTPGQRYGERVVFCAPYRSIIQRYRLSDSPEPAPSPPLGPAPLHPSQGEPEHEPTVRE